MKPEQHRERLEQEHRNTRTIRGWFDWFFRRCWCFLVGHRPSRMRDRFPNDPEWREFSAIVHQLTGTPFNCARCGKPTPND